MDDLKLKKQNVSRDVKKLIEMGYINGDSIKGYRMSEIPDYLDNLDDQSSE